MSGGRPEPGGPGGSIIVMFESCVYTPGDTGGTVGWWCSGCLEWNGFGGRARANGGSMKSLFRCLSIRIFENRNFSVLF